MNDHEQPEALRLAEELDAFHTRPQHRLAAAELRRLYHEVQRLQDVLDDINYQQSMND